MKFVRNVDEAKVEIKNVDQKLFAFYFYVVVCMHFKYQRLVVSRPFLRNSTGCNLQINKSTKIDKHLILPGDDIEIYSDKYTQSQCSDVKVLCNVLCCASAIFCKTRSFFLFGSFSVQKIFRKHQTLRHVGSNRLGHPCHH